MYPVFIILQSKGGVGKSQIARSGANYAMEKQLNAVFYNCDNESKTLSLFFDGIKNDKPENIKFKNFDLLINNSKFDINKFDTLLEEITTLPSLLKMEKIDFVMIDMGARSSSEFINYLNARSELATMLANQYGFIFLPIIAGGNIYTECKSFVESFPKDLASISKLIFNKFNGDNADLAKAAHLSFPAPEFELTALEELKDKFAKGFTPISLQKNTSAFRYMAFKKYLDECNKFFEKLLGK